LLLLASSLLRFRFTLLLPKPTPLGKLFLVLYLLLYVHLASLQIR
jgi:hypothetical protein